MYDQKDMDLTRGKLGKMIVRFVIPLALTGMLQQMFNAADVAVVGRFAGKNAMAAVGSNSSIVGLLINLFVGLATGVNVVIAQSTGEKNFKRIGKEVHTSIILAVTGGVSLLIIGELIAEPLLIWTSIPVEIFDMALLYLRIYILGLPILFLYNFEASIFRSQGDTKTPLLCLLAGGILNVILNLFLVIVMNWSVAGVAIATVFSNLVSSLIMFILLLRTDKPVKIVKSGFRADRQALTEIVSIGLPAGMQMAVFSISGIIVQYALNQLGADVIAATSAAFYIEVSLHYIVTAFGQTCTTFVGQNYGAGKLDRCRKTLRISLAQCAVVITFLVLLGLNCSRLLLSLFNTDPSVIEIGVYRLRYVLPASMFNVIIENVTGAMRGLGKSLVPAALSFVGVCGLRVLWVYTVFAREKTFFSLLIVHPISWGVTSVVLCLFYFYEIKKIKGRSI